jgi:hypothetical protein
MGWADQKLKQIEKAKEDERLRNEASARLNALQVAEAPRLWDELKSVLKQEISQYNETFPSQLSITELPSESDTSVIMLGSPVAEVMITFHRKVPRIIYEAKITDGPLASRKVGGAGSFVFDVFKGDELWLAHITRGNREGTRDVSEAASILLNFLVA